jgi:hypothetical protein
VLGFLAFICTAQKEENMKAIGIDIWVEKEELRKKKFHPHNIIDEFLNQEELRRKLTELVEKLQREGWEVIDCGDDRVRVLADDEKVNSLCSLITKMLPGSNTLGQIGNSLEYRPVPEDTPIHKSPCWDENRSCGIKDFSRFHPAEDELLVLVRHWTKERYRYLWFMDMEGGGVNSRELFRGLDRPIARIARIEELLGEDLVAKAVEEGKQEFEKSIGNPAAFEIFMHGDHHDKETYCRNLHSACERKRKECDEVVSRFIDEQSLDEKQAVLLRELARFGDGEDLS